jgi:solute carrier family 25 iron transporter 28/37
MGEIEFTGGSFRTFLLAGALAGTAEHTGLYPFDTVKTHLQATTVSRDSPALTMRAGATAIYRKTGVRGFFRGLSAVVGGAAPAHAVYFSAYEVAKKRFRIEDHREVSPLCEPAPYQPARSAAAGIVASMAGDFFHVPMDTVKQRMQLGARKYSSAAACVRSVVRNEGARALWASYSTTLAMSVPYSAAYFSAYESLCKLMYANSGVSEYDASNHFAAGAGAGMVAAALTNPLDVAKTRLQTQGETGVRYRGLVDSLRQIVQREGLRGCFAGVKPRMVFHSTSGALSWSVYEWAKFMLE